MFFLVISFMSLCFAAEPSCEIALDFEQPVIGRWYPTSIADAAVGRALERLDPVATYEVLLARRKAKVARGASAWAERLLDEHPGLDVLNQVDNSMAGSYELDYHVAALRGLPRHLARFLDERGREHDQVVLIDPSLPTESAPVDAASLVRASRDIRDLVLNLVDSELAHVVARNRCFFEMKQLRLTPTTAEFSAADITAAEFDLLHHVTRHIDPECRLAFFPRRPSHAQPNGVGHAHFTVGNLTNATMLDLLAAHPSLTLVGIE